MAWYWWLGGAFLVWLIAYTFKATKLRKRRVELCKAAEAYARLPTIAPRARRVFRYGEPHPEEDAHQPSVVCVTGGLGFLGRQVVHRLRTHSLGRFKTIRIVDIGRFKADVFDTSLSPNDLANSPTIEFVQADVTNFDQMRIALKDCEAVYHLAGLVDTRAGAMVSEQLTIVNVVGTHIVAAAAKVNGVKRIVYASSSTAGLSHHMIETALRQPASQWPLEPSWSHYHSMASAYGRSKRQAEDLLHNVCKTAGIRVVSLRPDFIFGFGDLSYPDTDAPSLQPVPLIAPDRPMQAIYVKTAAAVFVRAEEYLAGTTWSNIHGRAYNIGGNILTASTVHELCWRGQLPPASRDLPYMPSRMPTVVGRALATLSSFLDVLVFHALPHVGLFRLTPAALNYALTSQPFNVALINGILRAPPPCTSPEDILADMHATADDGWCGPPLQDAKQAYTEFAEVQGAAPHRAPRPAPPSNPTPPPARKSSRRDKWSKGASFRYGVVPPGE